MKPYYEEDGITIYHGDCREVLPYIHTPFDLVATDPPYPNLKGGMCSKMTGGVAARGGHETLGIPWGNDISILAHIWQSASKGMLLFCSFHGVPLIPQLIGEIPIALVTWYKRNSMPPVRNVPHFQTEFIWAFSKESSGLEWRKLKTHYDIPLLQGGCMATERIQEADGSSSHPAQKPLLLLERILLVGGDLILDPYMGSGTTLLAAKNLGRKAIGIEIEEKYCEIAVKRLAQSVMEFA